MKGKSLALKIGISSFLISVIFFIVDITNVVTILFGKNIKDINLDVWNLFYPSLITVALFIFTYIVIEKKQSEKEENKTKCADLILMEIYQEYESVIILLENDITKKKIIEMVDFDKVDGRNEFTEKMIKVAEKNYESLLPFLNEGVLDIEKVQNITRIRKNFLTYVNFAILLFDHPESYFEMGEGLKADIVDAKSKINVISNSKKNYMKIRAATGDSININSN